MRGSYNNAGFTIVEMLVTVVLASIFLVFFIQMYRATSAQQLSLIRQSIANDIARSNLAKFPTATSVTDTPGPGYTCSTTVGSGNPNNLALNANAPGTQILAPTSREPDPGNLGTLTQEVRAFSPQDCGTHKPVKLKSIVTYGFEGQLNTVEYATYVF